MGQEINFSKNLLKDKYKFLQSNIRPMDIPLIDTDTNDYESLKWGVVFCNVHQSDYGQKIHIASPYQAKDTIKNLDWESTHRTWDEDVEMWSIDLAGIGEATVVLDDAGFSVAATQEVGEAIEATDVR